MPPSVPQHHAYTHWNLRGHVAVQMCAAALRSSAPGAAVLGEHFPDQQPKKQDFFQEDIQKSLTGKAF